MPAYKILVVDDSLLDLEIVSIACSNLDCPIDAVSDPVEALERYKKESYTLVLTDYQMQPMDGVELITQLRKFDPGANCLIMTGYPDSRINNFINEVGISSIILKPIRPANLTEQLRVALYRHRGATEKLNNVKVSNRMDQCIALLGQSPQICQVRKKIASVLDERKPLSIEGAYGTGKPMIVDFIHNSGSYAASQMVKLDCQELPAEGIESKLISEDGEWGSALLEAENGTLVLLHVECIPTELQKVLARGMKKIAETCRIITWTNGMLDDYLDDERIIPELFFELTLNTIHLPPLSERPIDIDEIVRFVAAAPDQFKLARRLGSTELDLLVAEIRREALDGNLRELIERVRASCQVDLTESAE